MQNQQFVQGVVYHRINLVVVGRQRKHHVQEVLRVGIGVFRIHNRVPDTHLVGLGCKRWHLGQQAVHGQLDVLERALGNLRLRVKGRHARDHARQDTHRVRTGRVCFVKALHVFVHQRVVGNAAREIVDLFFGGEFTVNKQIGYLKEGRIFAQLFDGIAPVPQDAVIAVEEGNGTFGSAGILKAAVERNIAGGVKQLGYVNGFFVFSACNYGKFVLLAVENQFSVFGHLG